ncbi:DUF2125 domain-containing protein [Cohaesibacter celericrescens]|uniref:DUF2125 domain-containing protein n=1 Tax=Cohaesibacter celericrescens TaxID=2067669 RepID=UPI003565DA29
MSAHDQALAKSRPNHRKYVFLGLFVLLVIAGWSAFWYVSYTKTQSLIDRLMARQINGTPVLQCQNQTLGGYPFRLLLTCSSYTAQNAQNGWRVEGGAFRAIWQIYTPNLALIESDTRLTISHQPSGQTFDMVSSLMRGSVRFSPTEIISRASFEAANPTVTSNNPAFSNMLGEIKADSLAFHARPNPDESNDLDLSMTATELAAGSFPIVSGQFGVTLIEGLSASIRNQGNPARAWLQQSGEVKDINGHVDIGQKTLKLNGDVSFDQQGLANGLVKLKILNPSVDAATAGKTLSAQRDGLNGPLTALQLMGKPVKDGDLIGSEVDIKLKGGNIQAGFLPLGRLPAIQ